MSREGARQTFCTKRWLAHRLAVALVALGVRYAACHELSSSTNRFDGMTLKQSFGRWLLPRLPINEHVFNHIRVELNAIGVRANHALNPATRARVRELRSRKGAKLNLGCGPFGMSGWINLDLYSHKGVTLAADCRYGFPIGDGSCRGIHIEHYFEHLNPTDERGNFLRECHRCLEPGGTLRIIVPDVERFVHAYVTEGWSGFKAISADGEPEGSFRTKMEALNHVFLQGYEHYGGYDYDTLATVLQDAGFSDVARREFGQGRFPDGCIDRELHRPYSLYVEAVK